MFKPSLEEFKKLSKSGNLIPVYKEILADLDTPVSAYMKISDGDYSFLLESVEGGEQIARYSFIGTEPESIIVTGKNQKDGEVDPLVLVEEILSKYKLVDSEGLPRFYGGAVGYLGYETVRYFENLPMAENDPLELPESILMITKTFLVFDHVRHKIQVVSLAHVEGNLEESYLEATQKIDLVVERLNKPLDPMQIPRSSGSHNTEVQSNMLPNYHQDMVLKSKEYVFVFHGMNFSCTIVLLCILIPHGPVFVFKMCKHSSSSGSMHLCFNLLRSSSVTSLFLTRVNRF